jgi:ArsR family transcriptional regulator
MKALRSEVDQLHAQLCKGLASTNRILILYALADQALNVSDLAETLEMPQPTVSRHLKVLRDSRIVHDERQGQSVVYSLADRRVIEALDLLRQVLADSLREQSVLADSADRDL